MALTHSYTLICEQARIEIGNKFTIIGLTTSGIGVPQIPFRIPVITFFNVLKTDAPVNVRFRARVTHLLSGAMNSNIESGIAPPAPGPVIMPIVFQNLQLNSFGTHVFSLEFDGTEPFLTNFDVTHVMPGQVRVGPGI